MKTMSVLAALAAFMAAITGTVRDDYEHNFINVDGREYVLTFEDEFDGTELDTSKWERCPEWHRQDLNNYWDDSMSYLDGSGNLIIAMDYDKSTDRYLSGGIRSKGLFEQRYGYFEIRCAVNNIPGYWTAFWLMGEGVSSEENGGVDGTEIDIMETAYFSDGQVQHTLNWDGYGDAHKVLGQVVDRNVYDGEYHIFSLLWTEEYYAFYIDGEQTWFTDAAPAGGVCEIPLYMKITSEVGSWTPAPPAKHLLPDVMKVDYVRVYSARE